MRQGGWDGWHRTGEIENPLNRRCELAVKKPDLRNAQKKRMDTVREKARWKQYLKGKKAAESLFANPLELIKDSGLEGASRRIEEILHPPEKEESLFG
jgi:hypothetical protein